MSFLYEPHFLQQLIELTRPIKKLAQTAEPVTPADPNTVKSLATKLLDNLSKATSIVATRPDTMVYMRDLQSLDQLIEFLKINQIQFNGKWIVSENYNNLDPADKALYVPYKSGGGVDAMPTGQTVGIYKDGLIAYLKSLLQKAHDAGGTQENLLSNLINKLVDSANKDLKLKIDPASLLAQKDKTQPLSLPPDMPLDSVNEVLIMENPNSPEREMGPIKITPRILQNKMDFDAFARQVKVQKGKDTFDYAKHTSENFFCDILQFLYTRAHTYAYRRGANLDKAYLQLVETMAGQYSCNVTSTTGTGSDYKQTAYHPEGSGGGSKSLSPAGQKAAITLIDNGPFLGDRIDLPRIRNWLNSYATLAPQVNADHSTVSNIQNALQMLDGIITKYNVSRQSFAYNANAVASAIMNSTPGDRARKVNAPNAYLNQLKDLVNMVGSILTDFRGDIYDNLPDKQWQNALDEQIGSGASSFYNITIDKVSEWLTDLPSVLQTLRTQGF